MEQVFAVPTAALEGIMSPGLFPADEAALLALVAREGKFYDRTPLETDLAFKQPIPYVLVEHAGKFLTYQRTKKQGDARIHGLLSIGFGGHVNPCDAEGGQNPVLGGRARELDEEIGLESQPAFIFIGALNANRAPIDAFHLGFIYKAQASSEKHTFREPDKFISKGWLSPAELAAQFGNLESWSQEVFQSLYPQLVPQHA